MEELIKRLERVIQMGAPDKDGMHPISAETVLEVVNELSEHGTNLAQLGTDAISRQSAIDAFNTNFNELVVGGEENAKTVENYLNRVLDKIKCLPSAQPEIVRCKDCDWWAKQEDSPQGRCELLQMYPTGGWFCGNARRREVTE